MNTALILRGRNARSALPAPLTVAAGRQHTAETILRAWAEGKTENTLRSYEHDLEDFAQYFSRALAISPLLRPTAALDKLFQQSSPSAHEIVLGFRHFLETANLSAQTINRHLACLRSLSKLARMLGLITWHLEVPNVKGEKRRDTTGPTAAEVRQLLEATSADTEAGTRDHAIITMFFCMGLRVSELCGLNAHETDLERGQTWILGKGRRERELVPMPAAVVEAVRRYLTYRGTTRGPLFLSRGDRGRNPDGRLETRSVLRIVRSVGERIGLHVWCHALRHSSITTALDLAGKHGMGLEKVKAHSRHRAIGTLLTYHDEHDRKDTQRKLADLVASTLTGKS